MWFMGAGLGCVDAILQHTRACVLLHPWPFPLAQPKKSIRLREEALAKEEEEKAKSGPTSAQKLRKILKEEKR